MEPALRELLDRIGEEMPDAPDVSALEDLAEQPKQRRNAMRRWAMQTARSQEAKEAAQRSYKVKGAAVGEAVADAVLADAKVEGWDRLRPAFDALLAKLGKVSAIVELWPARQAPPTSK